jgi:choline transport protein
MTMLMHISFFPPTPHPVSGGMNWSVVIYSGVVIFALLWFGVKARHVYVGPVEYVRKFV